MDEQKATTDECTIAVADGKLTAWLEPMIPGLRSEELRPFLCAITSKPGAGANVMAILSPILDDRISIVSFEVEVSSSRRHPARGSVD